MSILRKILLVLLVPHVAYAQDVSSGGTLIGFMVLVVLAIGIPTIIGIGVRFIFKTTIVSYILSYVLLLGLYILAQGIFEDLPGGGIQTIAFNILPLSMLGSVIAHWLYYLKLPTRNNS